MLQIKVKEQLVRPTTEWFMKAKGVVLVANEADRMKLLGLLIEQDDAWKRNQDVVKVVPKEVETFKELNDLCVYVGKTCIWEPKELQEQVPFIMYQIDNEGTQF